MSDNTHRDPVAQATQPPHGLGAGSSNESAASGHVVPGSAGGTPARGPTRELLHLALPIVGLTVSRMLMGFVDFVMVSWLGTDAQAAISPATLFVFAVGCAGMGVATAVQTFVSQAAGRGESHEAGGYAWQSLYIAVALTVVVGPAAIVADTWFAWLARLAGHPAQIIPLEVEYVRIALWSALIAVMTVGLEGFFNGIQRPRVALVAALVALAVNTLGNWLLIFGNLGFPRMGIAGAAVATVIGFGARTLVLVVAMLDPTIDQQYHTRRSLLFRWDKLKGLLGVGGPTAVQWILDLGSWVVFLGWIIPAFGLVAMAATNVGLQLLHLSFMPAIGIGIALCSQVGFAIGQGRPEEARLRTRVALGVTVGYMGVAGLLFLLARGPLIALFNADPTVIAAGSVVMIWAAIFQVFDAMGITYMNALRGAGDTRFPAVVMAVCCWGVFVGGGVVAARLVPSWGLSGPWGACTLYIVLVGVALWWRWRGHAWQRIRLFEGAADKTALVAARGGELPAIEEAAPNADDTVR